jgi:hypothetical protein
VTGADAVRALLRDQPSFHVGGTRRWNALEQSLHTIRSSIALGDRTVETGCGASTVVFAASGTTHTAISPDGREHELVREYCRSIGVDDGGVTYVEASSADVLPEMFSGRPLDFAFIDGAHSFPYPIIDWHYITCALKVGGKVLLDDIPIPAIAPAFRFMRTESQWRLEGIFDERAALFTLVGLPPPEDYVLQVFNRTPDYSFVSIPKRIRIRSTLTVRSLRRSGAERFPRARRAWKAMTGNPEA